MTKEQKVKIYAMRLDGYSLEAIAHKFGVSRQYIHMILPRERPVKPSQSIREKCVYKGLGEYMAVNRMTMISLSVLLGHSQKSTAVIRAKLTGKVDFTLSEIRKILEYTGLTFEECFELKAGAAEHWIGHKKKGDTDEEPID